MELWESIKSLYFGKDNLHQIYGLTLSLLQPDVNAKILSQIYIDCHYIFQQWIFLLPITNDVNAMHSQREQFEIMCFLMSLPLTLSIAYQQILSNFEPLTMKSTFYHIQHVENDSYFSNMSWLHQLVLILKVAVVVLEEEREEVGVW